MIIEDDKNALAQQANAEGHPDDAPPAYHAPPGQPPYAAQGPEKSQPPQETLSFPQGPPSYGAGPSSSGSGYAQASSSRAVPNPAPSTSSKPGDLLNPPPPSFSRPPQQGFPYPPFHTMVHLSLGKSLDKGFPAIPPGSAVQPHPFMTHDVNEEDWTRFLGDLKKAGTLSPMDKILATGTPIVLGLPVVGIVGSIFLGGSFAERMKNKKSGPASQLVDHWNHYFFHPRLMEVSLCRGHKTYSGINKGRPADLPPHTHRDPNHNDYDSDSSSSSSSSDDSRHGTRRAERRARRAERRAERRERRRQRREERQERRGQDTQGDKPWRLVVVFRPLPGAPAPNPTTH